MNKDKIIKILVGLCIFYGVMALTTGHMIMAGLSLVLAAGIWYNYGGKTYNDRNPYDKIAEKGEALSIEEIYEAIREIDTPFGKPWIGHHVKYQDPCIVIGPGVFKDYILIQKEKDGMHVKSGTLIDNLVPPEDQKWRFEQVLDTTNVEVTPKRYSSFAAYKVMASVLSEKISGIIDDLAAGKAPDMTELGFFRTYHYDSFDSTVFDLDDNQYAKCSAVFDPLSVIIYDMDGEELAACRGDSRNAKAGFAVTMSGEPYGTIYRDTSGDHDAFTLATQDGLFRATSFRAIRRANVSSNYMLTLDGEEKAILVGSAKIEFSHSGLIENDVILSFDDDYLLAYVLIQDFIMTINHFVR